MSKNGSIHHPTAIIDPGAKIDADVYIGPYAIIGPNVKLHKGVRVESHAVIDGYTSIGAESIIFPHATIGSVPQDLRYRPCESYVQIGERTTVRESVTINPGSFEGEKTAIGNDCLLMAFSHVAHNCVVKNNVILANSVALAGYVSIEDYAIIGGLSGIHQFVRIGSHVMVGGMTLILQDVVPYGLVGGNPSSMSGINIVGLKRRGFSDSQISAIKEVHKWIFREKITVVAAIKKIEKKYQDEKCIQPILDFLGDGHFERGLTR
ncbi:acyl-[acyl-carrier-protein]--UDP-N-acetylglucosamine O-acyltransferase [PVC group bacterium (ex Bugula neritina AB1)]|nr:acyl-[acyl-carrier-protein]--UDP-N-acetylglucosamine O-acyltransferase [PVC group bacterium (ex Bugula neritina AB1)]